MENVRFGEYNLCGEFFGFVMICLVFGYCFGGWDFWFCFLLVGVIFGFLWWRRWCLGLCRCNLSRIWFFFRVVWSLLIVNVLVFVYLFFFIVLISGVFCVSGYFYVCFVWCCLEGLRCEFFGLRRCFVGVCVWGMGWVMWESGEGLIFCFEIKRKEWNGFMKR